MKTKVVNGEDSLSVSVMCPEMVNHISKKTGEAKLGFAWVISNSFEQTCWANTECILGIDAAKSNQTTHGVVAMPTCPIHCYHNYVRACIKSQNWNSWTLQIITVKQYGEIERRRSCNVSHLSPWIMFFRNQKQTQEAKFSIAIFTATNGIEEVAKTIPNIKIR